jgi:hypothetical protein
MFKLPIDDRLSAWASLRTDIETYAEPLRLVIEFWHNAPFTPYNRNIDQYHQKSWPSPWEIIVENVYDDFTKALMMGYSLKLTKRFNNSVIELRTIVDKTNKKYYNIICVDNIWVINYHNDTPVKLEDVPESFLVDNLIDVQFSR